jgi:hypothetical protein
MYEQKSGRVSDAGGSECVKNEMKGARGGAHGSHNLLRVTRVTQELRGLTRCQGHSPSTLSQCIIIIQ